MLNSSHWLRLAYCLIALVGSTAGRQLGAQDIAFDEEPLIDQQPFDLITLKPERGGQSVKVLPIDAFANRQVPSSPKDSDKFEVVLVKFQERRYEIAWSAIAKIDLFEQRIYDEALQKMGEKDFVTAFQNLSFLLRNYPGLPRLEDLRQEFIFQSAIDRFTAGELRQTLSALEELRTTAPGFKSAAVTAALSKVADSLLSEYQQAGDLGTAKAMLARLKKSYGAGLPVVNAWELRLHDLALAKKDEALQLMSQKEYRQARKAVVEMISIFPDLKEGATLIEEINRLHPMVRVGVMQRSSEFDPTSLINWPARRSGALVYQPIFQFLETGSEGGRYGFALGTSRMSDDRQQLILSLDPNIHSSFDALGLAQELLQRADPEQPIYDPSWAAILKSVATNAEGQVIVQLNRPNVLPHALMQWIVPDELEQPGPLPGKYMHGLTDASESSFLLRDPTDSHGQPVEIIEVFYDNPRDAVNDLLKGDIDVLDQLFPADAKKLAANPQLRIGAYALPSTHMLVPVSDHEYLANKKFRRALLYATNRQAMLAGELLNSSNYDDGRLISGPFPIGSGQADPLSYANNPDIEPTGYSPHLAKLLLVMTDNELKETALKLGKPVPKLGKLVVGCPDFEFARVALQAMIQQWAVIGIEAEMQVLASGEFDSASGCDLLYLMTTMWEPATDVERLLGGNGITTTDDPFIVQSLEKLRAARNWREIRFAMQDLHQLIDYHLPIIPLWQVTDRFAVSRHVQGLEGKPVSLYEDISQWRVHLGSTNTVQR